MTAETGAVDSGPVTLLINGNARRGLASLALAERALREAGFSAVETCLVRDRGEAEAVLRRLVARGAPLVVVGGGDGTLSHAAGVLARSATALGVLPLGTGNTFARSVGVPLDLRLAAQVVASGRIARVDVGLVNGRVFLNSVALGFSAELARRLDATTKRRLGLLAWPVVGAGVIVRHRALRLRVSWAARSVRLRTHQLVVANGRYLAGPLLATPSSSVADGQLDVFALGGNRVGGFLWAALNWAGGQRAGRRPSLHFGARAVSVVSEARPVWASVDGELNEHTPLTFAMWPGALWVMVPAQLDLHRA